MVGYQRQLTFQRSDGGYAIWGNRSPSSSTWLVNHFICLSYVSDMPIVTSLTAFVLRIYALAMDVMYIDETSMLKSLCWLMNRQRYDGSFVENGQCYHLTVTVDLGDRLV